jgi:hypothetical protein
MLFITFFVFSLITAYEGGTLLVAQLVEALRYKPEGNIPGSHFC